MGIVFAFFFVVVILQIFTSGAKSLDLVPAPNSPINTSSGVTGSLQCTMNSDESYAVCASESNRAVKYNLQPFSFAVQGPSYRIYMLSCDLYETSSQSTSRAVCVTGYPVTNGVPITNTAYFYRITDMTVNKSVAIGATGGAPHVIVDTPNRVAYISNDYGSAPTVYKMTAIDNPDPSWVWKMTSFDSGDQNPAAMLIIDGFLYVHFGMSSSRLARINISTFTWIQTVKFAISESYGFFDNLANDDHFIYDLTLYGFLVRCTYKNNIFARFDSLATGLGTTNSLAISPDQRTLFVISSGNNVLQLVDTKLFSMFGNSVVIPSVWGRPIVTSRRYVYVFALRTDVCYVFRYTNPTKTQSNTSAITESFSLTSQSTETRSTSPQLTLSTSVQPSKTSSVTSAVSSSLSETHATRSKSENVSISDDHSFSASSSISSSNPSESRSGTRSMSRKNTSTVTQSRSFASPSSSSTLSLTANETTSSSGTSTRSPSPSAVTKSRSSTTSTSSSKSQSSSITTSRSSTTSQNISMTISSNTSVSASSTVTISSSRSHISSSISVSASITITESETIADCTKILNEDKCYASHCQWCHELGACVHPTDNCSTIQCSYFTSADPASVDASLCPNSTCHYCPKTRTCLNRTEDPVCSCAVASTSSLACDRSDGECFWCKNEFSYFGRPPNSVSLCIENDTSRSAPDQFCSCEFLSKDVCTSKGSFPCAWCHTTGGCFDRSVKTCDEVRCTDFTNVAANGQCPSPACQICDGICVDNNTEYSGDRCSEKYFDQTTCEGCHNCTWNEKVLDGVNDAKPYCVMSQNAASCPSPLTCTSINLPGFDRENQCLAAGCKYDQQKNQCVNLGCFNFFLDSFILQPIGLMMIGFVKDVVVLLLFGVFGDRVVKIFKIKMLVPFQFWKNKWDKNRIKVNLERTIYVNDEKARDFTSDKGESFEEYCQKIAEKFFELPETSDEEIRKDWKRRIVDAVTFAMFDTGLWFDLDDDGYGKLDDEKAPKKLNVVEALILNGNDEENENQEQEIQIRENELRQDDTEIIVQKMRQQTARNGELNDEENQEEEIQQLQQQHPHEFTPRENEVGEVDVDNSEILQHAIDEQTPQNDEMWPEILGDSKLPLKKLFIAEDALVRRPMLQTIVQRIITENATCVVYYASSRVTSVRAATALNSFPSPLQLFYYLIGIIFLVSTSFVTVVLNDENQSIISRIASYSCSSSNSTSSSVSSDVGVFRSTFILLGFRLMNASTVATVFLVLVKTVRAIWASYGGRFNQLQLPQRLPIMGLYTKRSSQILLGFYFGVVLIFALVGFFYGFKITASLKVMGVTIAIFIGDAFLLFLIRFITSRSQERNFEKQKNEIRVEEEELASGLISHVNFDQNEQHEHAKIDFDEITAQEVIDVKKQSLSNSAPTSLPQALIVFLLTEEFPTVLLTISLQLCYNYMCLVEYKSAFGFTDENMSEISTTEYESRSMKCVWELFQTDVSGYANALSSFVAFL